MSIFTITALLGGLAMFLFGMDVMGKALERQAGGKPQTILSRLTDHPVKGLLMGLVVTAVIQSSAASIAIIFIGTSTTKAGIGTTIVTCIVVRCSIATYKERFTTVRIISVLSVTSTRVVV